MKDIGLVSKNIDMIVNRVLLIIIDIYSINDWRSIINEIKLYRKISAYLLELLFKEIIPNVKDKDSNVWYYKFNQYITD